MFYLYSSVDVIAPVIPPRHEPIPAELAQSPEGAIWDMPVLVIRYLPTVDGVNLDTRVASDFYSYGDISLADMMGKIDVFDRYVKFMLVEGSRFRGYKSENAPPSLGYRVVDYISVFEPLPPGDFRFLDDLGNATHFTDYHGMFDRLGIETIVNDSGVREIWIWNGSVDSSFPVYDPEYHNPLVFIADWESNMSSPTTPDLSNSNQDPTDLPIYNHTYVLYGQNIRRSQAEAIHNHGHQLERILSYAEFLQDGTSKLFNQDFIGFSEQGQMTLGRAGWTHMPPNTTANYDWQNPTLVASDIEDWRADNSGAKTLVNKDTWGNLSYAWPGGAESVPQRTESQWYIYWMQNMPGLHNRIPYREIDQMSNWWYLTARWDDVVKGYGLHTRAIFKDGFE